jgi:hypothetical protein
MIHGNAIDFGDVLYPLLKLRMVTQKEMLEDSHAVFYQDKKLLCHTYPPHCHHLLPLSSP